MKKRIISILFLLSILIIMPSTGYSCTTFVLHHGKNIIFCRNLDWYSGTGLAIVNQRNLEKVAIPNSFEKPAKWVSKYGSITFNQIGRELPFGGINESGLVVEHMTLDETVYPSADKRNAIGAFQWIQFQLDNYSTVEEVIKSDSFLRISDTESKIHFLVCDCIGHSAVIEFLNGKMVFKEGNNLPIPALANSTYDESLNCYNNDGSTLSNPSLGHFCTVAREINHVKSIGEDSTIAFGFKTLNMVSQQLFTKWSIIYDITNMRIYIKIFETPIIQGENKIFTKQPPYDPTTKVIDFKTFNFNCYATAKVFDLNSNNENEVNKYFIPYSTDINKEFIDKAFTFYKRWGLAINLKEDDLNSLARYPETFKCSESK
jgi:choloylglycine hydrolase